jgi:CheY-like chemotaxis protein
MTLTVPVVNDSKPARIVVKSTLKKTRADRQIVEAANAWEALDFPTLNTAGIALIDLNMVDRDTLCLAAKIRAIGSRMPCTILSANAQDTVLIRARELGGAFVEKLFPQVTLAGFQPGAALKPGRADK